jgi:hypothetical protein
VTTRPRDPAGAGRDRLRAGHADREQAIEALKTAFVVGRLTKDEFAARTGQALAARTYADLAALTADLPAEPVTPAPAAAGPVPAVPAPALRRPMAWAAAIAGVCLVIAVAAVLGIGQLASGLDGPDPHASWIGELLLLAIFSVATALSALGVGAVVSIEQRRSRRQLPPRPGPGGRALDGKPYGGAGHDPVPPGHRTDETQADLRAHESPQRGRRIPARTGQVRGSAPPAPSAA